jgi:hypothetical protein
VYIRILFVMLLRLLSKGFELGNNPIGNGVGSIELGFLSSCQVRWSWCGQFDF